MSAPFPALVSRGVTSIDEAIARMETIEAGLPATVASTNSLLLWQIKDDQAGYELLGDSLAVSSELASRLLLVAV